MLKEVISTERAVAWNEGAIVLTFTPRWRSRIGERWAAVQPPLARPDLTHFTNEGYNLLGRYIAGGIMKLYDSGPEAVQSAALEGNPHPGEILPPLFSEINGAGALSAGTYYGYLANPQQSPTVPAQIYYFLRNDGQLVCNQ